MNKILKSRNNIVFPVNVSILRKTTSGKLLGATTAKNMILKEYGLYSYIRFLLGSFSNGSIWDYKQYVPKYLAVGSNSGELTGAPGTKTTVKITDTSLYHELDDSEETHEPIENNRIKLNRANYIEDSAEQNYLKIQYEAYIPENRFVGQQIGELALMTQQTGWNAFARISNFEPFIKEPNTVVQIIWEISVISVESNNRFEGLDKKYLKEAIEKAIDVLYSYTSDPSDTEGNIILGAREALNKLVQPVDSDNPITGLYLLLHDNDYITQDVINNFLSSPYVSVTNTGLIPLINLFDPDFKPIN